MQPPPDDHQPPGDRRAFFRHAMLWGLTGMEKAGRSMLGLPGDARPPAPDLALRLLRPPGALPEPDFASTCSRCGDCVRACPAQCIVIDNAPDPGSAVGGGMPYIIAGESPCVVCDELACMNVCPTGALRLVDSPRDIAMGFAVVDHDQCIRPSPGSKDGEDCTLCISDCPIGDEAIGLDGDGLIQVLPGCVGCGVCERVCPTDPSAVIVEPTKPILAR